MAGQQTSCNPALSVTGTIAKSIPIWCRLILPSAPVFLVLFVVMLAMKFLARKQHYGVHVHPAFQDELFLVAALALVMGQIFVQAFTLKLSEDRSAPGRVAIHEAFAESARRFFPLVATDLRVAVPFGIAALLAYPILVMLVFTSHSPAGSSAAIAAIAETVLFIAILPALAITVPFVIASPVCVMERSGPIRSMRRAWVLTSGNRWRVLATFLVAYMMLFVVSDAVTMLALGAETPSDTTNMTLPLFAVGFLENTFLIVVSASIYQTLRTNGDAPGTKVFSDAT